MCGFKCCVQYLSCCCGIFLITLTVQVLMSKSFQVSSFSQPIEYKMKGRRKYIPCSFVFICAFKVFCSCAKVILCSPCASNSLYIRLTSFPPGSSHMNPRAGIPNICSTSRVVMVSGSPSMMKASQVGSYSSAIDLHMFLRIVTSRILSKPSSSTSAMIFLWSSVNSLITL